MIKVLLVDDSPLALTILKRMLSTAGDIEVVGTAKNGEEALRVIPELDPKVILTDLHMPVMDGLEFTKEVMDRYPRPILVVSVSVREGSLNVFNLIGAGAVDVFQKPKSGLEAEYLQETEELVKKVRILSGVHVFRRAKPSSEFVVRSSEFKEGASRLTNNASRIVAIGASTGGPQALQQILAQMPSDFRLPIVCVQHIGEMFLAGLIEWLQSVCQLKVRVAQDGEMPAAGNVYFPREGTHLVLDEGGRFRYSMGPPVNGHRPSITVTFNSVAERCGKGAIGVLLTGMGSDGAEGMKAIADAGGTTIVQDEMTSIVFGMPKQAIELNAAEKVLPLYEIGATILEMGRKSKKEG
ncbi:MAG: chemotaxis-specific protein-glutamate methyltransferase CheB [Deltaproteobacteria bacterium]